MKVNRNKQLAFASRKRLSIQSTSYTRHVQHMEAAAAWSPGRKFNLSDIGLLR